LFAALAVGAGAAPQSSAQQTAPPKSAPQPPKAADYSSEPFVIEHLSTTIVFENDGTSTQESSARIHIQFQAGVQFWGTVTVPYPSAQGTAEVVYTRALKPDGRVVQTPQENVIDMPTQITQEAPFYSDLKALRITVRGLEIGDTLEYQCRQHITKATAPGQFWYAYNFFESGIALDEQLQISVPHERYVKSVSPKVQPAISEQGPYRVYTWKTAHLQTKSDEKNAPTPDPEDVHPSVQITSFRSWDEIGMWFQSLFEPQIAVTPEIQAKADELSHGAKTDAEKIQAIYNFVSKFRYVGNAFGIGRYQPHAAPDVLTND